MKKKLLHTFLITSLLLLTCSFLQAQTTPQADLAITKTASTTSPQAGSNLTYIVTVTNNGPNNAVNVVITDPFPAAVFPRSIHTESEAFGVTSSTYYGSSNTLQITADDLPPGASITVTIVVEVSAGTPNGTPITNTATVSADTPDPNSANNSASVTVQVVSCVLTCPGDITVYTGAGSTQCGKIVNFNANATAGCGTVTYSPASGSFFPVGTTPVTATSSTGRQCSFNVIVRDDTPPTITCPANITVNPTSPSGATVTYPTPTATDNCAGVTVNRTSPLSTASGSSFPIGTTTVSYQATDASGLSTTCSFTVTVRDPICDNNPNNQKGYVCHNGSTQCISVNALQTHLDHGDKLGMCGWYAAPSVTTKADNAAGIRVDRPVAFALSASPNPVAEQIRILYNIPMAAHVSLKVYDVAGREVGTIISENKGAGSYTITYNMAKLTAGIYYARMIASTPGKYYMQIQKLVKTD